MPQTKTAPPEQRASALPPGGKALDFSLSSAPDRALSLGELLGRPLVVVFYPADWSPVCGDQLVLYNEVLPDFQRHNASIVAVSVDSVWCHAAYAKHNKLRFPLLSDFEPKGEVARRYGAYRKQDGFAERALFVIDAGGTIRWSYVSPVGVNPGADGILTALENLAAKDTQDTKQAASKVHS